MWRDGVCCKRPIHIPVLLKSGREVMVPLSASLQRATVQHQGHHANEASDVERAREQHSGDGVKIMLMLVCTHRSADVASTAYGVA